MCRGSGPLQAAEAGDASGPPSGRPTAPMSHSPACYSSLLFPQQSPTGSSKVTLCGRTTCACRLRCVGIDHASPGPRGRTFDRQLDVVLARHAQRVGDGLDGNPSVRPLGCRLPVPDERRLQIVGIRIRWHQSTVTERPDAGQLRSKFHTLREHFQRYAFVFLRASFSHCAREWSRSAGGTEGPLAAVWLTTDLQATAWR